MIKSYVLQVYGRFWRKGIGHGPLPTVNGYAQRARVSVWTQRSGHAACNCSMSDFPLFSDHGPRASTEVTFTPGGHEPQTELEQCPSELIGIFTGIDKEVFLEKRVYQGRSIK